MTDERGLQTVADAADALTEPMHTVEVIHHYVNGHRRLRRVEIRHPSLLDQLAAAVIPGEVYAEDELGSAVRRPGSAPPAQLEAIHAGMAIAAAAATWCLRLGLRPRDSTVGNIRSLVGARTDSDQSKALLADLKHWYGWAMTVAGWRRPPWTPPVPCPLCGTGGLRVRLDAQTACCVDCGEASWSKETIGELAEYVQEHLRWSRARAAAARLRARAARVVLA